MKRLKEFLMVMLTLLTLNSSAFNVGGLEYKILPDRCLMIIGGNMEGSEWVIPSTVVYEEKTYTITEIGNNAFQDNMVITKIQLPSTITKIGNEAFSGCYNLESVNLPESMENIFNNAFAGCSSLMEVRCEGEEPPFSFSDNIFSTPTYYFGKLIVPDKALSSYKYSRQWLKFKHIIGNSGEMYLTLSLNQDIINNVEVYVNDKKEILTENPEDKRLYLDIRKGSRVEIDLYDNYYQTNCAFEMIANGEDVSYKVNNGTYVIDRLEENTDIDAELIDLTRQLKLSIDGRGCASFIKNTYEDAIQQICLRLDPADGYEVDKVFECYDEYNRYDITYKLQADNTLLIGYVNPAAKYLVTFRKQSGKEK